MIRGWTVDRDGVRGWLVVDTLRDGLSFGGTRFSPTVTADEVAELARCMTWKLHAHGLPVGGAKAGLAVDPDDPDLPRKLRVFAEGLREPLTTCAVIGKDLGATNAMLDAIYAALGVPQLHLVQRRHAASPGRLRDLAGYRRAMTGQGLAWAARALLGADSLQGARVAIQGAGVVGRGAALRLGELGARTVAISDVAGTMRASAGLDPDAPHAPTLPRDAALAEPVDLLVLAAGSHVVDATLAWTIQAPVVVEGANFGLTPGARAALRERGVTVLPDVLANSAAAAMTARQLAAGGALGDAALWDGIEQAIDGRVRACMRWCGRHGGTLRDASLALAADAWPT